MPELPEVETARRGIAPHLIGQRVAAVIVRQRQLRWPVPKALGDALPGQIIRAVERRAKYILIRTDAGTVLLHLGMSGSLRVLACHTPPQKADHVDIALSNGQCLRLRDPRRFGSLLWTTPTRCNTNCCAISARSRSGRISTGIIFSRRRVAVLSRHATF